MDVNSYLKIDSYFFAFFVFQRKIPPHISRPQLSCRRRWWRSQRQHKTYDCNDGGEIRSWFYWFHSVPSQNDRIQNPSTDEISLWLRVKNYRIFEKYETGFDRFYITWISVVKMAVTKTASKCFIQILLVMLTILAVLSKPCYLSSNGQILMS